jgi:hypothetical protein
LFGGRKPTATPEPEHPQSQPKQLQPEQAQPQQERRSPPNEVTKDPEAAAPRTAPEAPLSPPVPRPLPADRGFDPANLPDKLPKYLLDPENARNGGKASLVSKGAGI